MNVIITGRQMELTNNLKEYAESKIKKFEKFINNISEATVTLSVEKYRHKAEVLLKVNGSMIQAESVTGEMYSSIDDVVEKLGRQIKKHKEKWVSFRRTEGRKSESPNPEKSGPVIIRKQTFDLKPMNPEEAAMQMELLDKNFFVFTDSSSGRTNVLYRRKDGDLGLIEPVK